MANVSLASVGGERVGRVWGWLLDVLEAGPGRWCERRREAGAAGPERWVDRRLEGRR